MTDPVAVPSPLRRGRLRRLGRLIWNTLAILGLLLILQILFFDFSVITSNSMDPTLRGNGSSGGDWLLSEKITYRLRSPRRWELVQFRNAEGILVAKRVAGLPGEEVSIQDRHLAINGQPASVPPSLGFCKYYAYGSLRSGRTASCGRGYFLLGDDSMDSLDSRFEGPLAPTKIHSRPWLIVWPPSRIGWANP